MTCPAKAWPPLYANVMLRECPKIALAVGWVSSVLIKVDQAWLSFGVAKSFNTIYTILST